MPGRRAEMQRYVGWLHLGSHVERLDVEVLWDDQIVCVATDSEEWHWLPNEFVARSWNINDFRIDLEGDATVFFHCDAPLRFAFEFIPALDEARTHRKYRRRGTPEPTPAPRSQPETSVDERWTSVALGRDTAELLEALDIAAKRQSLTTHTHGADTSFGPDQAACRECTELFIDLGANQRVAEA